MNSPLVKSKDLKDCATFLYSAGRRHIPHLSYVVPIENLRPRHGAFNHAHEMLVCALQEDVAAWTDVRSISMLISRCDRWLASSIFRRLGEFRVSLQLTVPDILRYLTRILTAGSERWLTLVWVQLSDMHQLLQKKQPEAELVRAGFLNVSAVS